MGNSKLINGDCLEELKKLDDDSVDLLCTDPPYGYGFMGKHWDTFQEKKSTKSQSVGWMSPGMTKSTYGMKEFFVPIWKEALRVVKPGGFAFVMSAPRSDVQMVMVQTLAESGFDVSFSPIYWTYATGFPKALNIGKAVDKRLNKKREVIGVKKRGDVEEAKKKGTTFTRAEANQNNKDIFGYGEEEITSGPASDEAKKLDGSYAGYQPKPAVEVVIVAMKPLGEKMGYVDQALDNGKGVTWLDDCRIPFTGMSDEDQFDKDNVGSQKNFDTEPEGLSRGNQPSRKKNDTYERVSAFGDSSQSETKDGRNLWGKKATKKVKITKRKPREEDAVFKTSGFENEDNNIAEASPLGRFAANLLVSDDILNDGKTTRNATENSKVGQGSGKTSGHFGQASSVVTSRYSDEGSFSRYYSLDAWWKFRMSRLPVEVQRTFPFLIVPKASKAEKNKGCDGLEEKQGNPNLISSKLVKRGHPEKGKPVWSENKGSSHSLPTKNNHPTVKPIDLMSYLVTLGSRKDDVVLDPFAGSGTTVIACVFSERNYILIEREKEYFKIMEARIKKAKNPADLVQHEWF